MTNRRKPGGLIAARDLPSLKAWDFPRVAGAHVVRSPFKERQSQANAKAVDEMAVSSGPLTVGEIEKLRAEAKQQGFDQGLAEGKPAGHQQGLKSGQAEGHKAAYAKAQAEIDDLKARLHSMQVALERPIALQDQALEQALIRLVVDTCEVVVKQELATRPELLQQAVRESLDALPQQAQQLCFFVHPDDEPVMQQLREQQRAGWEIAADPALTRGGLRVRGESSYLDYRVEKRFSQVVEQVLLAEQDPDGGADDSAG
ncbi:MAG: flagellar assembly protein FliH [Motiliproteus sp.]